MTNNRDIAKKYFEERIERISYDKSLQEKRIDEIKSKSFNDDSENKDENDYMILNDVENEMKKLNDDIKYNDELIEAYTETLQYLTTT